MFGGRSLCRRRIVLAAWLGVLGSAASASAERFVYAGAEGFPPFEYLDPQGEPAGFNVALIRALAQRAGHEVEVRLGPWPEQVAALETGEVDVMALAASEAREERFDFLARFWTLRQSVVFRGGQPDIPPSLDALGAEVVAVMDRGLVHELLEELPEASRPVLLPAPDPDAAVAMLLSGDATAAAGNSLTLRTSARARGLDDLVEVPVKSLLYHFATRRGGRERLAWLEPALAELRASGEFERLVEQSLALPPPEAARPWLGPALGGGALLLIAGLAYLGSLRGRLRHQGDALRSSELRLATALDRGDGRFAGVAEAAVVPILLSRLEDGRILWANPAAGRLARVPPEELVGRNALDFYQEPADREAFVGALMRWGEVYGREVAYRSDTGVLAWLSVSARLLEVNGENLLVTSFQDVTSRRRSEETTRALLSAIPDLLFRLDADDVVMEYHAPDEAQLAVAPETFIGRPVGEVLPERVGSRLLEAVARARTAGESVPFEYQLPDRSGRVRDWESRAVRTRLGDVLVVARDVTQRKRSEARLQRMRDSLRESERLATVGSLVAGVAHEVRNPLFAASAALDAFDEVRGVSEESAIVRDQLDRIQALTESLLELGRPRRNTFVPTPVREIVEEAAARCDEVRTKHNVLVEIEIPASLPKVMADRERLAQALRNLIDNAVRASPPQAAVRVTAIEEEGRVRIDVLDRGPGVDPADIRHVFEPFYTRRPGGTGLGLAIVDRVARDHGGRIEVEPLAAGGTRFTLWLGDPAAEAGGQSLVQD